MMSSYFYPGSSGGNTGYKSDELGNRREADKPRQLSLLDWMLQRTEHEPHISTDQND